MNTDPAASSETARVAACIRKNPGISSDEIIQKTGISRFWTEHAIRKLRRTDVVLCIARDGFSTYSIRQKPRCAEEKILQEILGRAALHQVFSTIVNDPGISGDRIGERTGLSEVRINWYLSRLEMFGAVKPERDKHDKICYTIADAFAAEYKKYV